MPPGRVHGHEVLVLPEQIDRVVANLPSGKVRWREQLDELSFGVNGGRALSCVSPGRQTGP